MQKEIVKYTLGRLKKLQTRPYKSNTLKNKYLDILTEYWVRSISYFRNYYRASKRYFMFMERSIEKGGGKQASDDEMFKMN